MLKNIFIVIYRSLLHHFFMNSKICKIAFFVKLPILIPYILWIKEKDSAMHDRWYRLQMFHSLYKLLIRCKQICPGSFFSLLLALILFYPLMKI